jgi:hypothetical protein
MSRAGSSHCGEGSCRSSPRLHTVTVRHSLEAAADTDTLTDCLTRYYPQYSVERADVPGCRRQYYNSLVPHFIHVTEKSFVERELCVYFEMQMVKTQYVAGVRMDGADSGLCSSSAEGIASVYNSALGVSHVQNGSRLSHLLTGEVVLDAFFCHAVLRDKCGRQEVLSVPHDGPQRHRLDEALQERNYRMAGTGQEMWAHACDKCMKVYRDNDGRLCKQRYCFRTWLIAAQTW